MKNGTIKGMYIEGYYSNGIKFGGYINEKTGQVTNFSQF